MESQHLYGYPINLMPSLVHIRKDINFVLVDVQGIFIGAGSDGKALIKSMLLIK